MKNSCGTDDGVDDTMRDYKSRSVGFLGFSDDDIVNEQASLLVLPVNIIQSFDDLLKDISRSFN